MNIIAELEAYIYKAENYASERYVIGLREILSRHKNAQEQEVGWGGTDINNCLLPPKPPKDYAEAIRLYQNNPFFKQLLETRIQELNPAPQSPKACRVKRLDSVHDQLKTVKELAYEAGCYDARNWITSMQGKTFFESQAHEAQGLGEFMKWLDSEFTYWNKVELEHPEIKIGTIVGCILAKARSIYTAAPSLAESLAELADRKNCWIDTMNNRNLSVRVRVHAYQQITMSPMITEKEFIGKTYAEAEAKSRKYLEALEDQTGGEK